MRLLFCSIVSLLLVLLAIGCNTVSPDECWVNTSGGFGGSGTMPIGAGVGAVGSGDFDSPKGGTPNPCVTPDTPETPPSQTKCQVPSLAGDEAASWSCGDECSSKCPAPGMGIFVDFKTSDFQFVTTVQDDGTGKAGGYQVAKVNLKFVRIILPTSVETWWCPFTIKMPLRTEFMGKIPASLAAGISLDITEGVAHSMLESEVPQGIFCIQFVPAVDSAFGKKYPLAGAHATK